MCDPTSRPGDFHAGSKAAGKPHPPGRWVPSRGGILPLAVLATLLLLLGGCTPGAFLARRILRAPNSYPDWLAPAPRVVLDFQPRIAEGLPRQSWDAPSPRTLPNDAARLSYRIVPPARYQLTVSQHPGTHRGRPTAEFRFDRQIPAPSHPNLPQPRGTVILLHGYGLSQGSMLPWALLCGDLGWQSILVDLRGHGRSTGRRISLGPAELDDLDALFAHLDATSRLPRPIVVLGVSLGGALALQWTASQPALDSAIAIAPYPRLAPAIERIRDEFAPGVPRSLVRAAARSIPGLLGLQPEALDPVAQLRPRAPDALLIGSTHDTIAPPRDVEELHGACTSRSRLLVVDQLSHEQLPFHLPGLAPEIQRWLDDRLPRPDAPLTGEGAR